jgi:deoxyribonuclease IV
MPSTSHPERPFGAHVPGGVSRLIHNASLCGADVGQIFASNPRGWATPGLDPGADATLREALRKGRLTALFVHAPYLVNLAASDERFRERSAGSLAWTMRRAGEIGAAGVVVHAGAGGAAPRRVALRRVRNALRRALDADDRPSLIVELTAGGRGMVASRWPEAADVLEAVGGHPRVLLCFDTCHALAAGYDLAALEGMTTCLEEMTREVGPDRLALIHANDSRDPIGSRRDRHWHIGQGTIGLEPFRVLLRSQATRTVPVIVETPGRLEDHARNIAKLRSLSEQRTEGTKRSMRHVWPATAPTTRGGQKA